MHLSRSLDKTHCTLSRVIQENVIKGVYRSVGSQEWGSTWDKGNRRKAWLPLGLKGQRRKQLPQGKRSLRRGDPNGSCGLGTEIQHSHEVHREAAMKCQNLCALPSFSPSWPSQRLNPRKPRSSSAGAAHGSSSCQDPEQSLEGQLSVYGLLPESNWWKSINSHLLSTVTVFPRDPGQCCLNSWTLLSSVFYLLLRLPW